jgi:RimJ/RimL family protein N-acetyltransferase
LTPDITTERLILSPLSRADAEALFAYRSLAEVSRFQGWEPRSLDDALAFIEGLSSTDFDTPGTWFQFGIRARGSERLVGDVGVHFSEDGQQAEVGFTLAPASQGQGFGTEAVVGVIDHLFVRLGKHRVYASVDPQNQPSLRLLERVGMRQEGHFRQSLLFKGEWADDVVFAILRPEWAAARAATGAPKTRAN